MVRKRMLEFGQFTAHNLGMDFTFTTVHKVDMGINITVVHTGRSEFILDTVRYSQLG